MLNAFRVMIQHVPQTLETTVVHVGEREFDVAQCWDLELQGIRRVLSDQHSSKIIEDRVDGQPVVGEFTRGEQWFLVACTAIRFEQRIPVGFLFRECFSLLHYTIVL